MTWIAICFVIAVAYVLVAGGIMRYLPHEPCDPEYREANGWKMARCGEPGLWIDSQFTVRCPNCEARRASILKSIFWPTWFFWRAGTTVMRAVIMGFLVRPTQALFRLPQRNPGYTNAKVKERP